MSLGQSESDDEKTMTGVRKPTKHFLRHSSPDYSLDNAMVRMAISELGRKKIGSMNGLANSLYFPQCFQDKLLVNSVEIRLNQIETLPQAGTN